jgi:hypothetical protein
MVSERAYINVVFWLYILVNFGDSSISCVGNQMQMQQTHTGKINGFKTKTKVDVF